MSKWVGAKRQVSWWEIERRRSMVRMLKAGKRIFGKIELREPDFNFTLARPDGRWQSFARKVERGISSVGRALRSQ